MMGIVNIAEWPIFRTDDGYFRYVNHAEKLMTTGFMTKEALERNADIIRIDSGTLKVMAERYRDQFGD